MNKEQFIVELKKIGIEPTVNQLDKLDQFYKLLVDWNNKINLTTITDYQEVYLKHFYDSLTLFKCCDLNKKLKICDVGSGAGFPGIVLKVFFPNLEITLVDSLQKRVNYLNHIIEELQLKNIVAIHSRMEDFSIKNEEKFDIITARAVAKINILLEISIKSLKINGQLILLKANCYEELQESMSSIKTLGCRLINICQFQLPIENSNRTIINIEKIKKTSNKYPRMISKISKNPL